MKTKQSLARAAGLFLCALATAQNPELNLDMDKLLDKLTFTNGTASLPYRSLKPDGYNKGSEDHYPLVIFLHGIGERGTNNQRQLRNGVEEFVKDSIRKKQPCFLVVLQCPPDKLWCQVTPADTRRNLPLAQSPTEPGADFPSSA